MSKEVPNIRCLAPTGSLPLIPTGSTGSQEISLAVLNITKRVYPIACQGAFPFHFHIGGVLITNLLALKRDGNVLRDSWALLKIGWEPSTANHFGSPFLPREGVESSIFIYVNYLVVLIIKMGKHDIPSRLLYVDQYDSEGWISENQLYSTASCV